MKQVMSVAVLAAFIVGIGIVYSEDCPEVQQNDWSYEGNNSAEYWYKKFPDCGGHRQSPIALDISKATVAFERNPLEITNYDKPLTKATVKNDVYACMIYPKDEVRRTLSANGEYYELDHIHLHWLGNGKNLKYGDVAGEIHLDHKLYKSPASPESLVVLPVPLKIHLDHKLYKSPHKNTESLAVLAVPLKLCFFGNSELKKITRKCADVPLEGDETELGTVTLGNLLPKNDTFYYYKGSLSTPPCTEDAKWDVFVESICISTHELEQLTSMYLTKEKKKGCTITHNGRPLQDRNGRDIFLIRWEKKND